MIKKEDLVEIKEILDLSEVEGKTNHKKLYTKIELLLKGIELQEELNKNSEELQELVKEDK